MNSRTLGLLAAVAVSLCACGGNAAPAKGAPQSASATSETPSRVCSLLTDAQVATVVPGHGGGHDEDTSEAALLKDVTIEHCKYYHVEGTDLQMLDVLIYKASSDEGFKDINIGKWAHEGGDRSLDVGDLGYLMVLPDQGLMATASKDHTVFELKLISADAAARSEQLVELARVVAGKLWG